MDRDLPRDCVRLATRQSYGRERKRAALLPDKHATPPILSSEHKLSKRTNDRGRHGVETCRTCHSKSKKLKELEDSLTSKTARERQARRKQFLELQRQTMMLEEGRDIELQALEKRERVRIPTVPGCEQGGRGRAPPPPDAASLRREPVLCPVQTCGWTRRGS